MTVLKKVPVVGAWGYFGRYAVNEFKERGYHVRALVRNPERIKIAGSYGDCGEFAVGGSDIYTFEKIMEMACRRCSHGKRVL
jgi:putative NADH-flavin reductase